MELTYLTLTLGRDLFQAVHDNNEDPNQGDQPISLDCYIEIHAGEAAASIASGETRVSSGISKLKTELGDGILQYKIDTYGESERKCR